MDMTILSPSPLGCLFVYLGWGLGSAPLLIPPENLVLRLISAGVGARGWVWAWVGVRARVRE